MLQSKSHRDQLKSGLSIFLVITGILLLALASPVFAQTATTEDSVAVEGEQGVFLFKGKVSLGFLNGESHELVYDPDTSWKMSELIWDLDSVYMLGGELSIRPLTWLGFNLEGWVNISEGDGSMDDYDWIVYGLEDWTHWSHHDKTEVKTATLFDISAEFFALNREQFSLSILAGYKRNNFKWEAYGGDFIYSTNTLRDTVFSVPDDNLGITYEQWWNVPYIGVGFATNVGPVEIDGRIIGSTLVDAEDEDHHHNRDLLFKEEFEDGNFIGLKFGATYNITQNMGVGLDLDYQNFDEVKGDTTIRNTVTGEVFEVPGDSAGADNELLMISLGFQYRF